MATVTSLGFNLTSKWDGSGVRDARNDLASLYTELQAIERTKVHIQAEADTASAIKQLREAAEDRKSTIEAQVDKSSSAAAESHLDFISRDRTSHINVDTDKSIRGLNFLSQAFMRSGRAATEASFLHQKGLTFGQLAAVGFVAAINLIGPAASLASSVIATALPMGMVAAAAVILRENEAVKAGWESLSKEGGEIFKRAAQPMVQPLVDAMDQLKRSLRDLEPEFERVFANTAPLVEPMTRGLTNFAESVLPGVADGLKGMGPLMESFARSGEMAGTRLGNMFRAMGDNAVGLGLVWEATLNRLFEFIEIIGTRGAEMATESAIMIDGILGGINALMDGFLRGVEGMMQLGGTAMAQTWMTLGQTMGDAFAKVLPPLGELIGALSLTLLPLIDIIVASYGDFVAAIIQALIPAVQAAAPIIVAVAEGFDQMMRFLIPLIAYVAPAAAALRTLTFVLTTIAAMSPVAWVIRTIGAALSALAAHPVVAVLLLAGGIYYLATQTEFFQNVWQRFAPGSMKNLFEEGADGTSRFSRAMDDLKGKLSNVWDSIKGWASKLKDLFSGDAASTVKEFGEGFRNAFDDVKNALGGLIEPIKGLFNELGPVLKVMAGTTVMAAQMAWEVVNGVIQPALQLIGDVIAAIIKAIEGLINIISGAIRFIKGLVEVVIGIVQVVVGFFSGNEDLFNKGWEKISQGLEDIIQGIGNMLRGILQIFRAIWDTVVSVVRNGLQAAWNVVFGWVKGIIDFFTWLWDVLVGHSIVPDTINAIVNWFLQLPGRVFAIVSGWVQGVIGFFVNLATTVISTVVGWMQNLWNTFNAGLAPLRAAWDAVWNGIKAAADFVWNAIQFAWGAFLAYVRAAWDAWSGAIRAAWDAVWNGIKAAADMIWNAIKAAWDFALNAIRVAWDVWSGAIRAAWDAVWNGIKAAAEFIWNGIKAAWDFVLNLVRAAYDAWSGALRGAWDAFWNGIKAVAEAIWNGIKAAWDFFVNYVRSAYDAWSNALRAAWDAFWNAVKTAAENIWNAIKAAWDMFTNAVRTVLDTFVSTVRGIWEGIWNWFRDLAQGIWDNIKQRFEDFKNGVIGTIEGLVEKVREVWDRITGIFQKPVDAVKGIWNTVAGTFGLPTFADGGEVQNRADGGPIYGHGGPRDDRIPARLSRGEHVWTAREVDAAGGHEAVYSLRQEILSGRNTRKPQNTHRGVPALAEGGPVEWMWARVKELQPSMSLTSSYRDSADHHGAGKAVDVSNGTDSTPQMRDLTRSVHDTWGRDTLELIHSPSNYNIKDGRGVGDGMSFYGAGTMNAHRNHVHWAVPRPLDGRPGAPVPGGGGFSGPSPEQIAAHKRATDEIRKVVNQTNAETVNKKWGMTIHEMNRAAVGDFVGPVSATELNRAAQNMFGMYAPAGDTHGAGTFGVGGGAIGKLDAALAAASAAIGGAIPEGERLKIIEEAMRITNTPPPSTRDAWLRGMNTLISRESGWNPGAVNNSDSNAAKGTPSRGLAQVIQPTFDAHKVPGYNNINAPVDNVAASINYIKSRYGSIENVQQANANMPPKGYATGTQGAVAGWAVVGEKGPEAVRFRGGEQVKSFDDIIRELKERAAGHSQELTTRLEAEVSKAIASASADQKATAEQLVSRLESEIAAAIDRAMGEARNTNAELTNKVAAEVRAGIEHLASLVGIEINIPTNIGDGVNDGQEVIDMFKTQVVPQLEMALRQQIGRR
jgi:SLT domain-containing protein/phage-related protein